MGLLDRTEGPSHLGDRIVSPGKIYVLLGKKAFDDGKSLFQATNPCTSVRESHAQLLEIERTNACSQPQFKASIRQEIQGCCLSREKRGMPEIITEHITANVERGSSLHCYCQRRKYGETRDSAIWHQQGGVAEFFSPARQGDERSTRWGCGDYSTKTKWLGHNLFSLPDIQPNYARQGHEKQPLSHLNGLRRTLPFFSLASIATSYCPHQEKYPHMPYIFHA